MLRKILLLNSFLLIFCVSNTISEYTPPTRNYDDYRVAVVQYRASTENDPDVHDLSDAVKKNAQNYVKVIQDAKDGYSANFLKVPAEINNVTMIIFPEYGLTVLPNFDNKNFSTTAKRFVYDPSETTYVTRQQLKSREIKDNYRTVKNIRKKLAKIASVIPSPEENVRPCDDNTTYAESLRMISCAARNNSMYVVINHLEIVKCKTSQCAEYLGDFLLHNTNVVFDRNGTVIARYRKFHIHHEPWLDKISNPDLSIFTTDFNVTFAQLIGVDILRKGPTQKIFDFENITDLVYSTHLWDDLWLLNTKHDLYRWAYEYNADLMLSGSTQDGDSDMIVGKDGPVYVFAFSQKDTYFYRGDFSRRRLRKDCIVDKRFRILQLGEVKSGLLLTTEHIHHPSIWLIDDNSSFVDFFMKGFMESRLLDMADVTRHDNLCIRDFCCYFEYHTTFNKTEYNLNNSVHFRHRIAIFKTFYEFYDKSIVEIEVCALIACTSDKAEDCGKKMNHPKGVILAEPLRINTMVITRYMVPNINSYPSPLASRKSEKKHIEYLARQGDQFSFFQTGSHYSTLLVLSLDEPEEDLTFFGINVRTFDVTNVWESFSPPVGHCHENYYGFIHTFILISGMVIIIILTILLVFSNLEWFRDKFSRTGAAVETDDGL